MDRFQAHGHERFTFHDLKAKGYSDQEKPDAGHKSIQMDAVYLRKLKPVLPPEKGDD